MYRAFKGRADQKHGKWTRGYTDLVHNEGHAETGCNYLAIDEHSIAELVELTYMQSDEIINCLIKGYNRCHFGATMLNRYGSID